MLNVLQQPTRCDCVTQALSNLDVILLDHLQLYVRKAAGVALNMIFRYPSSTELVRKLTSIAREELEHFEQVNEWLERRHIPLAPLTPSPYGVLLKAQIRRHEPERLLDSLLIAGLIEARSYERLGLLATNCPEPELACFYRELMSSEASHYGVYWLLADQYFTSELVTHRLAKLATVES